MSGRPNHPSLRLPEQRRAGILEILDRQGHVRVSDLAWRLGVSYGTVHRDLFQLARRGLLARVHGGAVRSETTRIQPYDRPHVIDELAGWAISPEQRLVAARAAGLVLPGASIAIAAGITGVALAGHLVSVPRLTVVTNSVVVSTVFARLGRADQAIVLTGGVRTSSDALAGRIAEDALSGLHVGQVFVTPDGMSGGAGFTAADRSVVGVHRILMTGTGIKVVLADHTRWNAAAAASFAPLEAADVLISDSGLPPSARDLLGGEIAQVTLVERDPVRVRPRPR